MAFAVRVHETGGPEVLKYEEVEVGAPGENEVKIRQTAIGLNYIDTYFRSGLYPAPGGVPFIPGNEAAGEVIDVGSGVEGLKVGDRVAYAGPLGAYASERLAPAAPLVKVPDGVSDKTAAAMMLKGMTAQYLLRQTFNVNSQTTILYHAAAGGVGQIVGQWAKALGATSIGTVGSDEKAEIAKACGYTHVINYKTENFVERVKDITDGIGVDVAYDSVGKDTYPHSLDCIRPLGMWVSFGQSSGPLPPIELSILSQKGSLFATRPTLFAYIANRDALEKTAHDLFEVVSSGAVKIDINQEFALSDAKAAHEALEGRKTTGSTIFSV